MKLIPLLALLLPLTAGAQTRRAVMEATPTSNNAMFISSVPASVYVQFGGSVTVAARQAARRQHCVGSRIASARVGGCGSTVTWWGGVFLWLRHF